MTDTYNGKPIAEMTREELVAALKVTLQQKEELWKKLSRLVKLATGYVCYGSERWH